MSDVSAALPAFLTLVAIAAAVLAWGLLPEWLHKKLGPIYRRKIEEKYGPQSLWQDRKETREELEK